MTFNLDKDPTNPVWLVRKLPHIILPPTLTYIALSQTGHLTWVSVLSSALSLPLLLILRSIYDELVDRRAAKAMDAVLPPLVKDPTLGTGIGIIKQFVNEIKNGYLGDVFDGLTRDYGNLSRFKVMFETRYFTTEPDHIKAILATQFDRFEKGPITFAEFYSLLGRGVFNADGDIWKFHRSMTRPFFAKEKIAHFDIFERHADDALKQIRDRVRQGYPVDFQDMIFRFTLDSATEFLFGQDVCSLSAGLPYPEDTFRTKVTGATIAHPADVFAHSFGAAQDLTALRVRRGGTWPMSEFFEDAVLKHRKVVEDFIDPIIARALTKKALAEKSGAEKVEEEEHVTLLDHLVNCTEDQTMIRDEVLNIMIAGRDTTAATLTFMTYMLAEHPDVLKKLRREIMDKVGPSRKPTFEDIKGMKYLRAVLNETLRLYPVVPFNSRTSKTATTFPSKIPGTKPWYIPAGVQVTYSVFLMHRRKDLWGPDADIFDPDRFIDDRTKYLTKNPFIFLPFNAGPRICLGQQFAYNEASYFAIRFLQSFSDVTFQKTSVPPPSEWAGLPGTKGRDKIWPQIHLTAFVRGHVWFTLKEAEEEENEV